MRHRFTAKHIITAIIMICFLCTTSLPLGFSTTAHAFSVGEEREVGEKLLSIIRKEFKILDDPDITQYITGLSGEILKVAGSQFFDYHFFVIENKEFNAFAAPSGLIFVHSGLIEKMDKEDELIGVLAHECGHAASRHIADRIAKNSKLSIGTAALVIAGLALGVGALSEALVFGSLATNASLNLKFSRQDEEEADRLAFNWMQDMGRNPSSMLSMLHKMRKISILRGGQPPQYLLTHPNPAKRMNYVQDLLLIDQGKTKYRKHDDFAFQRIKARILTKTKNISTLLPRYLKKSQNGVSGQERIMADYAISQIYQQKGDFDKAITLLKKVIKQYPDKPILKTDLGIVYFRKGDHPRAFKLFKAAKAADGHDAYTNLYLAKEYEQKGDTSKAIRLYQELLNQQPTYSKGHFDLGKALASVGRDSESYYHLGAYYWYEGDSKTAIFHLNKAIKEIKGEREGKRQALALLQKIKRIEKNSK